MQIGGWRLALFLAILPLDPKANDGICMTAKQPKDMTPISIIPNLSAHYREDEKQAITRLLLFLDKHGYPAESISQRAEALVHHVRLNGSKPSLLESFLEQYGLTTEEGLALMCLAEALLRVPDSDTANMLIADKLTSAHWDFALKETEGMLSQVSSIGLRLSSEILGTDKTDPRTGQALPPNMLQRMIQRLGKPVIRQAMGQAMKLLGKQFVMGETLPEALKRATELEEIGYRYSYDMLGEGARTPEDASKFFQIYMEAVETVGLSAGGSGDPIGASGVSVKLSAIHARYDWAQRRTCVPEITRMLLKLAEKAKHYNIGLTVDAEEASRLEISLEIFANVRSDPKLAGWDGLGLAVQAYQKRAPFVIDFIADLAKQSKSKVPLRLVKGAYWDSEIKFAQMQGYENYPVFTRKINTDVSYLSCARKLLGLRDYIYPQFATHNAHTAAAVLEMAGDHKGYEFQRLHGMGGGIYRSIVGNVPCRIYAPVGTHRELLPYLVRRLLENGANSSFVNQLRDESIPASALAEDPVAKVKALESIPHTKIPLPVNLYDMRKNSCGYDLKDPVVVAGLQQAITKQAKKSVVATSLVNGEAIKTDTIMPLRSPASGAVFGQAHLAEVSHASAAVDAAYQAFPSWSGTTAEFRASLLEGVADAMESEAETFLSLAVLEAGKTLDDAVAELREAADFCRYYAERARVLLGTPITLKGYTGESNMLTHMGRGVFVCISPWNFPLAIFIGQIAAALVSGNTVIAKPAAQTQAIAFQAVELMHKVGVPTDVLQLVLGSGSSVGAALCNDPRISGVAFTGSTAVAKGIHRGLAQMDGPIRTLIAETGGQNAMIVDNTALAEQVVDDVISSSFKSAGQRCSALRVLCVQDEIADKVIEMLEGAVRLMHVGDPSEEWVDVGPVIDAGAKESLESHIRDLEAKGCKRLLAAQGSFESGHFVLPCAYEIPSLDILQDEHFGPVLHVLRFNGEELDQLMQQINGLGYGLTLGIHSRIESRVEHIVRQARVGNIYVNRNMTGAIVGVQPFGGQGLSGTGPKAGGPHTLLAYTTEQTVSVNTTAAGGNASLVSLQDDEDES